MPTFVRLALTAAITAVVVAGPVPATAKDAPRRAAPRGAMPAEVWQALEEVGPRRAPRPSRATAPAPPAPDTLPTHTPDGRPVSFAGLAHLELRLPGGVKALGFHESGTFGALPLHPIGRPRHNDNMTKIGQAPVDEEHGTTYSIMGSRGRGGGPTTAVDLAMEPGWPLQSPVTGTVEVVQGYLLYGRTHDYVVQIVPDSRPDLRVKLLHLDTVHVAPGHRVVAGETIIAGTARPLPVNNQVDRYAGPGPHVHIEVVPA